MKAFAYLRVSGINQIDGDGFPRQQWAIDKYAAQHGIAIEQVFFEEGVSGKLELEHRPALQELLAALDADSTIKTILIERLDRLARDLMVQENLIADLKQRGYTLISVSEPDLCHDDPSRKLMRQIFGSIAEYDRAMIVAKLRGARERTKKKNGRCEGQKGYGHYPGEAEILDYIRDEHRMGYSSKSIAKRLNDTERLSRTGKRWSAPVVAKILRRVRASKTPLVAP